MLVDTAAIAKKIYVLTDSLLRRPIWALLEFGGLSVVHSMALTRNYPPNRRVFVGVPGGTITYGLVLQGPRGSWGHASWPDSVGSAVLFVKRGMGMCQCRKTVASDAKG